MAERRTEYFNYKTPSSVAGMAVMTLVAVFLVAMPATILIQHGAEPQLLFLLSCFMAMGVGFLVLVWMASRQYLHGYLEITDTLDIRASDGRKEFQVARADVVEVKRFARQGRAWKLVVTSKSGQKFDINAPLQDFNRVEQLLRDNYPFSNA